MKEKKHSWTKSVVERRSMETDENKDLTSVKMMEREKCAEQREPKWLSMDLAQQHLLMISLLTETTGWMQRSTGTPQVLRFSQMHQTPLDSISWFSRTTIQNMRTKQSKSFSGWKGGISLIWWAALHMLRNRLKAEKHVQLRPLSYSAVFHSPPTI